MADDNAATNAAIAEKMLEIQLAAVELLKEIAIPLNPTDHMLTATAILNKRIARATATRRANIDTTHSGTPA
jgi:hypothetical protein